MEENQENQENLQIPKVGLVGFRNIGNTCYMASILQLLIHCSPIISFVANRNGQDAEYKKYVEKAGMYRLAEKERKRQGLTDSDARVTIKRAELNEIKENLVIDRFSDIINVMIEKGNSIINPSNFKSCLEQKVKMFRGHQQHDAEEFLRYVLEIMFEEETGIQSSPVINNVPTSISEYNDLLIGIKDKLSNTQDPEERKSIMDELVEYKKTNRSVINKYEALESMLNVFKTNYNTISWQIKAFTVESKTCTVCKNVSSRCENTSILQIPVVPPYLVNCLDKYIQQEEIDDYECGICGCKQKAISQTKIFRTPKILFIQLKRFKSFGKSNRPIKDDRPIEIPKTLDLNPYIDETMNTEKISSNNYKLVGIANHHGELQFGHYTADCAGLTDYENWYHHDDQSVTRWNDPNKMNNTDAYVLMYKKLD